MPDSKTLARPPQATFAGWMAIVGSVFVLFGAFDLVTNLRSIETRERVQRALRQPPYDGMDLSLEQVLDTIHVVSMVAGGCAVAAAILGWYVLQRNHSARLALTVLAVPMFLAGIVTRDPTAAVVAVAAVMLWSRPTRDWFNGVAPPPPPARPASAAADHSAQPPPYAGYGVPTTTGPGESDRPSEVVRACVFAWVFSGFVALGCVLTLMVLAVDTSVVREAYESDTRYADNGLSRGEMQTAVMVMVSIIAVWSLAAVVIAVFAFLRHDWARILLITSAALAGTFGLLGGLASPALLIFPVACALTVILLLRRRVSQWYAAGR